MLAGGQNPTLAAASSLASGDVDPADLEESGGAAGGREQGGEEARSWPETGMVGCGLCFGGKRDRGACDNSERAARAPSTGNRSGVFAHNGSAKVGAPCLVVVVLVVCVCVCVCGVCVKGGGGRNARRQLAIDRLLLIKPCAAAASCSPRVWGARSHPCSR
jgi:hypothetical protein